MKIPFVSRSQFLTPCAEAIQDQARVLDQGEALRIALGSGGYDGHVSIEFTSPTASEFDTDWSGSDPTRFPVRIRAAAKALRDCGLTGRFMIAHQDGVISIRRA